MHVLDITRDPDVGGGQGLVVLDVESDADLTGCPDCGIIAVGHGRHVQVLHDAPCFGTPVRVRWRKRIWRCCPEPSRDLDRGARLRPAASQAHQPGGGVEVSLLRLDDTTVSAIARLLDAVQGRSGAVYADWLEEQGVEVTVSVEYAALNPFRGYRNTIRDELPDTVAVLDAFHVVKLAGNALDEVRRRVQQATLGRRGLKGDPLYRVHRTLLTGVEHLTDRQRARLDKWLLLGDRNGEVEVTWHVYQQVRSIYTATSPAAGRKTAKKVLESLHTCPIPEVAKLGRTLRQWRAEILAYFDTGGVSNGGTEAINGVIEKTRRLAHGFRNFTNYRIRILLTADGTRPYRRPPTKIRSAERADPG